MGQTYMYIKVSTKRTDEIVGHFVPFVRMMILGIICFSSVLVISVVILARNEAGNPQSCYKG